ncbi:hypothetical protein Syncc8109_1053 [Synechococcus sp. WH 8109]|nr:hypothetical protein Syncc8109_1053 [Synechococcus sp. WH 8109]
MISSHHCIAFSSEQRKAWVNILKSKDGHSNMILMNHVMLKSSTA